MGDDELGSRRRSSSCMKNWVAWKWRWAMEARKAKTLSHRIKELENGSSELLGSYNNKGQNSGIRTSDNSTGMKSPSKMDPSSSTCWPDQYDRDSSEGTGLTKVEEMQKQVEKLSSCLNKMMPTLLCMSNKTSNKKPPSGEFNIGPQKCKILSSKSPNEKQIVKQEDNNNSITIAVCPTRRSLSVQKGRQPKVSRKASVESFTKPKPGFEPSSTTKCLQTLQVSVHHELNELQDLLSSGIRILQRERAMSSHNALVSVWDVSNNVAQLLNKARQALKWCEQYPRVGESITSPVPDVRVSSPFPNRHRVPCHIILEDKSNGISPRGGGPGGDRGRSPTAVRHEDECRGGTMIHVGGDNNIGHLKISTTSTPATRPGQGVRPRWVHTGDPSWQGRMCAAAEHASKLRDQIERLQSRQRTISMRLNAGGLPQHHTRSRPKTPYSPTTTLMFM